MKATCGIIRTLYQSIVPSKMEIDHADVTEMRSAQQKYDPPTRALMSPFALWKKDSYAWIPEKEEILKHKLLVKAHCRSAGPHSKDKTKNMLRSALLWRQLEKDVEEFVQNCLQCIIARSGKRIHRPMATELHGQHPNEVVYLDFLCTGPVENSNVKYVLTLKDDLTSNTWLLLHSNPDCRAAVKPVAKWIAALGSMEWLVSDRGAHFKSTVASLPTEKLHIRRHSSISY